MQGPGLLTPEYFLLTTLLVKVAVMATLATMLVRYRRFRHILIFERRGWLDRLVFTLVLPRIGQSDDAGGDQRELSAAAGDTEAGKLSAASGIEISHENYDNTSLTALISSLAAGDSAGGSMAAASAPPIPLATGGQAQVNKALACIVRSAPDETGDLKRLIRARFEGTPAYLAVFTEGPGAGQAADRAIIWVFATDDCRILSSSFAQL